MSNPVFFSSCFEIHLCNFSSPGVPRRDGSPTSEYLEESAPEVGVEDVVDDGVDHGAAVLEPLEGGDRPRRYVRLAALARAVHDVGGEERQVEHDEHGEQDSEDADGATTAVRAAQGRNAAAAAAAGPSTVGPEAAGTTGLGPGTSGGIAATRSSARTEGRVDRRRRSAVADGRRKQRLGATAAAGVGRTGCRVPDLTASVGRRLDATQNAACRRRDVGAVDAELVDGHSSLLT